MAYKNIDLSIAIFEFALKNPGCTRREVWVGVGSTLSYINMIVARMRYSGALYEIDHGLYPLYREGLFLMQQDAHRLGMREYLRRVAECPIDYDEIRERVANEKSLSLTA